MLSTAVKLAARYLKDFGKPMESGYVPKVRVSLDTQHLPRRLQNRNKYLGNGKLRVHNLMPMH